MTEPDTERNHPDDDTGCSPMSTGTTDDEHRAGQPATIGPGPTPLEAWVDTQTGAPTLTQAANESSGHHNITNDDDPHDDDPDVQAAVRNRDELAETRRRRITNLEMTIATAQRELARLRNRPD